MKLEMAQRQLQQADTSLSSVSSADLELTDSWGLVSSTNSVKKKGKKTRAARKKSPHNYRRKDREDRDGNMETS